MKERDIVQWVTEHVEPIESRHEGNVYRCSARLSDGTHLPCITIQQAKPIVDLALKRFDELRPTLLRKVKAGFSYRDAVHSFVCSGNSVNHYDIKSLEPSPFAIPIARLREIRGETAMSWTEFTVIMDDDSKHYFGTRFLRDFFDMPQNYTCKSIKKIIAHDKVIAFGSKQPIYREKPHFACFIKDWPETIS